MTPKVALSSSHRQPFGSGHAPVNPSEQITVTVALHKDKSFADIPTLIKLAGLHHLKWSVGKLGEQPIVRLTGAAKELEQLFEVQLKKVEAGTGGITKPYRVREGTVHIPAEESDIIQAVLGLDNRPAARPYFHAMTSSEHSYSIAQVASYYQFPIAHASQGKGQRIGIVEFGGGYDKADLDYFFKSLELATPKITDRNVMGAINQYTGDPDSADGEVMLDIEVAGVVAPAAEFFLYFAPNTEQGFLEALVAAQADKLTSLSLSWGAPEEQWSRQAVDAISTSIQTLTSGGCTVTVASGDSGSTDGLDHPVVDFPSSSPFSLACGGTALVQNADGSYTESVWGGGDSGATGGGFSQIFSIPAWQNPDDVQAATNQKAMRSTPDVAGVADPNTGYKIYLMGGWQVIGGTSAVAPLWAAFAALIAQMKGQSLGFINPLLYQLKQGDNFYVICNGTNGYLARNGWSACTGLGSPKGVPISHTLRA
jgi:kumamolisin